MLNVRPLYDRVLLSKLPHTDVSPILSFTGEKQSTRDSMVRMRVHAVGKKLLSIQECEVTKGSVVYVASKALIKMVRSIKDSDKREYWLLHYIDLAAVEE